MGKYHRYCSCIYCKRELTIQNLNEHFNKHHNLANKILCKLCNTPIFSNSKVFCSKSCAAQFNNKQRDKKSKTVKPKQIDILLEKFINGKISYRGTLRKLLTKKNGYKCQICNISTWLDKKLTLIVDHINGDASNNYPENLRLICPNCNSQTDTFSGRNKGNGRKSRGIKLH